MLIRRHGFRVLENRMAGNQCPDCATEIPGVWEEKAPVHSAGSARPTPIPRVAFQR
jgi:hypothetical protein